jgi:hypothetical protein
LDDIEDDPTRVNREEQILREEAASILDKLSLEDREKAIREIDELFQPT